MNHDYKQKKAEQGWKSWYQASVNAPKCGTCKWFHPSMSYIMCELGEFLVREDESCDHHVPNEIKHER